MSETPEGMRWRVIPRGAADGPEWLLVPPDELEESGPGDANIEVPFEHKDAAMWFAATLNADHEAASRLAVALRALETIATLRAPLEARGIAREALATLDAVGE